MSQNERNVYVNKESRFDATLFGLIGVNIVFSLICVLSLGLGYPIAVVFKERWTCERTTINGKPLKFTGLARDLFPQYMKWVFLSIITLGIYLIWVPVQQIRWTIKNTHFYETEPEDYHSVFTGAVLDSFLTSIIVFLMIIFSLGLATPWAIAFWNRWGESHTYIDTKRLSFTGTGRGLFWTYLKWNFFIIITLGLYTFWYELAFAKWNAKHRVLSNSDVPTLSIPKQVSVFFSRHKKPL